jgi:PKD repeat protein
MRICTGSSIVIEDGSAFDPENRKWDISPGGFEFINGTGPLSLKPEIRFNQPGNYSVQLIVENTAGKDTIRRTDFIKAGDEIRPKMYLVNSLDSCLCSFDSLTVMARGASDYLWSVKDTANFYSTDNTGNIFVIKGHNIELPDSIKGINISLIASQDGCRDTMNLDFPLISQPNDKLVNATEIVMGINGPFSNNCATVELLEPVPPHFSCTDQLSWCNETGVDILNEYSMVQIYGPFIRNNQPVIRRSRQRNCNLLCR